MTERELRIDLSEADKVAAEHPTWTAYAAWALRQRALYEVCRLEWRGQNPLVDVAALEDANGLTPAAPAILARRGG